MYNKCICNIIKNNYKALISNKVISELQKMYPGYNNNEFYMPEVFESIFTKEASLKYAIMESINSLNPIGELNINNRYIDIYIEKLNGIETKTSASKYDENQMGNYLSYLNKLFFGFMVTYNTELDIANLLINNRLNPSHNRKGFNLNRLIMASIAHNIASNNSGHGVVKYPYKMPKIAALIKSNYEEEKIQFYNNYIQNNFNNDLKNYFNSIGLLSFNPFGGVDILNKCGFNIPYNNLNTNNYKPEDKVKYKIWKYYRNKGLLIAAEAPLYNASNTQSGIFNSGVMINNDVEKVKAISQLSTTLRQRINEVYGNVKSPRVGKYIIDFVVLCEDKLIGIECKSEYSKIDLEQLRSYYDSKGIDYLYIAVGIENIADKDYIQNKVNSLLTSNGLDDVGIILVDNNISILKNAKPINNVSKRFKKIKFAAPRTKIYSFKTIPEII